MSGNKMQIKKLVTLSLVTLLLISAPSTGLSIKKRSLADDIRTGINFAGKIFGFDAASNVADLVSRAFSNNKFTQNKPAHFEKNRDTEKFSDDSDTSQAQTPINDEVETNIIGTGSDIDPGSLVGNMLRIIGMDNSKIGAMAVNGLIFIAQMIGRMLMSTFGRTPNDHSGFGEATNEFPLPENTQQQNTENAREKARSLTFDNSFDWILKKQSTNSMFSKQLIDVKDKNLPQRIVRSIDSGKGSDSDTACTKLLLCKCAPIIWGMQRAVFDKNDSNDDADEKIDEDKATGVNRLDGFFKHLPDVEEFKKHGYECEIRYSDCKVFP